MKTKWQTASGKEVLRKNLPWKTLLFYKKSDLLYQITSVFCKQFLPAYGDRTVNQMIQAARSGKQNIIEGTKDGMTSTEMELKLINVARSSLQELRADYEDYIKSRQLQLWKNTHPRYAPLLEHCRSHNEYSDYEPFVYRWTDEEFCNTAITLLHITDRMMSRYHEFCKRRSWNREESKSGCMPPVPATADSRTSSSKDYGRRMQSSRLRTIG